MCLPTLLSDLSLQAELQNLSQQLNQQIQVYTKQGFEIKDISSGMTPGSGKTCSTTNSTMCLPVCESQLAVCKRVARQMMLH